MSIPQVEILLPELMSFIRQSVDNFAQQKYHKWHDFIADVRAFYTPEQIDKIDALVNKWKKMSSYDDQVTLIHVTAVLMMLLSDSGFEQASPDQKNLMLWIVLYHDVGKVVEGKRDPIHALTSACITMKALCKLGFVDSMDETLLEEWVTLTKNATIYSESWDDMIADNSKLPAILDGIERLCGTDTPAGLLVRGVLFHMSITVVVGWEAFAPLTDDEIRAYMTPDLFALLRVIVQVDGDSWEMFKPDLQADHRAETRETFVYLERLLGY